MNHSAYRNVPRFFQWVLIAAVASALFSTARAAEAVLLELEFVPLATQQAAIGGDPEAFAVLVEGSHSTPGEQGIRVRLVGQPLLGGPHEALRTTLEEALVAVLPERTPATTERAVYLDVAWPFRPELQEHVAATDAPGPAWVESLAGERERDREFERADVR